MPIKDRNLHKYKYMQRLELETGKTCEACSIVHEEGTYRRP